MILKMVFQVQSDINGKLGVYGENHDLQNNFELTS